MSQWKLTVGNHAQASIWKDVKHVLMSFLPCYCKYPLMYLLPVSQSLQICIVPHFKSLHYLLPLYIVARIMQFLKISVNVHTHCFSEDATFAEHWFLISYKNSRLIL